uniref:Uncharacterized protein n=1 Tax=Romanomermis culicivorax TaxID=13658 RepID=A0A915I3G6_ROMCU
MRSGKKKSRRRLKRKGKGDMKAGNGTKVDMKNQCQERKGEERMRKRAAQRN